jgi:hypothetical protein
MKPPERRSESRSKKRPSARSAPGSLRKRQQPEQGWTASNSDRATLSMLYDLIHSRSVLSRSSNLHERSKQRLLRGQHYKHQSQRSGQLHRQEEQHHRLKWRSEHTEPGRYIFRFGRITMLDDLAIRHPNATITICRTATTENEEKLEMIFVSDFSSYGEIETCRRMRSGADSFWTVSVHGSRINPLRRYSA